MRAVYPLVLALLSSIPPAAFAQEAEPTPATQTISIDPEGRYTLVGITISRDALRTVVRDNSSATWIISPDEATPRLHIASVEELLQRSGVAFSVSSSPSPAPLPADTTVPPPSPLPPEAIPQPGISVPPPPSWVSPVGGQVRPLAEVRTGLQLSNLGDLDGPARAAVGFTRAALGAHATISPQFQTQILLNVVPLQGTSTAVVSLEDGTQSTFEIPRSAEGYGIRPRDLWADLQLGEGGRFLVRAGIVPPIFSVQPWFNDDTSGFYTDAVRFQTLAVLAGLQQVRAAGVSASARLTDDVTLSVMASNNDNFLLAEDNTGKDISGRLEARQGPVTGVLSARYAPRGVDNVGGVTSLSAAARLDTAMLRLMAEGLYGLSDPDRSNTEGGVPFVGLQSAATLQIPAPAAQPQIDAYRLAGRVAYFDPQAETTDADAWILLNGGARVALKPQIDGAHAQLGAGYEVEVPINLELAIVHRALLEALWRY